MVGRCNCSRRPMALFVVPDQIRGEGGLPIRRGLIVSISGNESCLGFEVTKDMRTGLKKLR